MRQVHANQERNEHDSFKRNDINSDFLCEPKGRLNIVFTTLWHTFKVKDMYPKLPLYLKPTLST